MAALSFTQFLANKDLRPSRKNNIRRPSLPRCSVTLTGPVSSKPSCWESINADITAYLQRTLIKRDPLVVHEPMHDLVFGAPKTVAPALCIAACELVGGRRTEGVVAAASAINILHVAYTHKHLPNLLERERPAAFGANIELLIGDSISPLAFEVLARSDGDGSSERILRVIVEVARAGGPKGWSKGSSSTCDWRRKGKQEEVRITWRR